MIIKNLGPIENLELELNKETIFIGKNNSGKTYVSYLLYGVYKLFNSKGKLFIKEYIENELNKTNEISYIEISRDALLKFVKTRFLQYINENINKELPKIYNLPESLFLNTQIVIEEKDLILVDENYKYHTEFKKLGRSIIEQNVDLEIDVNYKEPCFDTFTSIFLKRGEEVGNKELELLNEAVDISEEIKHKYILLGITQIYNQIYFKGPELYYIPAERNGINVFMKELVNKRFNTTFDFMFNDDNDDNDSDVPTYPLPISDYMKYVNTISNTIKSRNRRSRGFSDLKKQLQNKFSSNLLKGSYEYKEDLNEYYYIQNESVSVPLKSTSSSVKSLFGLESYVTKFFGRGDILFIDEPEMNLEPKNQIEIANILIELINCGVNIIISTHSDYLLRATTNKLLKEKIKGNDSNFVSTYYFTNEKIEKLGDLTENDFIENFDNANILLEKEYMSLLNDLDAME